MGGSNEFTAPAKAADSGSTPTSNLRIHENAGEVHFHDDANQLKAAVPVAAMYEVWSKLKDGRKTKFKHKDLANQSILRIKVIRKKKGPIDLQMTVEAMKDAATPEFTNFDRLMQGSNAK